MYVVICELCDVAAVVAVAVAVADERLFVTIGQAGPFFASFPPCSPRACEVFSLSVRGRDSLGMYVEPFAFLIRVRHHTFNSAHQD